MHIFDRLSAAVSRIENTPGSVGGWFFIFVSIVFLRNILEAISQHRYDTLSFSGAMFFAHTYAFYAVGALGIALVLAVISRERIERTTRFTIALLLVILMPPIVDLIATNGAGAIMTYRELPPPSSFGELLQAFVNFALWSPFGLLFFGADAGAGILPNDLAHNYGIRIEIPLLLMGLLTYVYAKTKNTLRLFYAAAVLFVGLFIISTLPSLISAAGGVSLYHIAAGGVSQINPELVGGNAMLTSVLVALLILLSLAWGALYNRRKFIVAVRNLRFTRVLVNLIILGAGIYFGFRANPPAATLDMFDLLVLSLAPVAIIFHWAWAVVHNDIADIRADRISMPNRPLPRGDIVLEEYRLIGNVALGLSLIAAIVVGPTFFILLVARQALTFFYSAPPARLKRIPGISNIILGAAYLLTMIAGFVVSGASIGLFPPQFILILLVGYALGTESKNIKDHDGDIADGVRTIPTLFGLAHGKNIVGALGVLAFLTVPIAYPSFALFLLPLALLAGGAYWYTVTRPIYREQAIFVICFLFIAIVALFDILGVIRL